ncbi:hypothetical protein CcaverHIS002_0402360 [Cutaneotrichosporon cavernicola]|nr:hypothetical protein CcaverHIS002_0402360 [Cutaneotrichosporon cavernicola]
MRLASSSPRPGKTKQKMLDEDNPGAKRFMSQRPTQLDRARTTVEKRNSTLGVETSLDRASSVSAVDRLRLLSQMAAGLPGTESLVNRLSASASISNSTSVPPTSTKSSFTTTKVELTLPLITASRASSGDVDPFQTTDNPLFPLPARVCQPPPPNPIPKLEADDFPLPTRPTTSPAPASALSAYSQSSERHRPTTVFPSSEKHRPTTVFPSCDLERLSWPYGDIDALDNVVYQLEAPRPPYFSNQSFPHIHSSAIDSSAGSSSSSGHFRHRLEVFRRTVTDDVVAERGISSTTGGTGGTFGAAGPGAPTGLLAPAATEPYLPDGYEFSTTPPSLDTSVPSLGQTPGLSPTLSEPGRETGGLGSARPPTPTHTHVRHNPASPPGPTQPIVNDSVSGEKDPEAHVPHLHLLGYKPTSFRVRATHYLTCPADVWISHLAYGELIQDFLILTPDVAVALALFPRLNAWDDFWRLATADCASIALLGPLILVALGECDFNQAGMVPFRLVAAGVAIHHVILVVVHVVRGAVLGTSDRRTDFGTFTRRQRVLHFITGVIRELFQISLLRGRWHRSAWSVILAVLSALAVAVPVSSHSTAVGLLATSVGLTLLLALWRAFLSAHRKVSVHIRQSARDMMYALLVTLAHAIDALALDALLLQLGRFTTVLESMEVEERRLFAPEEAAVASLHRLPARANLASKQIHVILSSLATGRTKITAPEATLALDAGMSVAREFMGLRRILDFPPDIARAADIDLSFWMAWSVPEQDEWYRAKSRVLVRHTLVNPAVGKTAQMLQDMCDPIANWGEGWVAEGERWAQLMGVILAVGVYRVVAPVATLLPLKAGYQLWIDFSLCFGIVCLLYFLLHPGRAPSCPPLANALQATAHLSLLRALPPFPGLGGAYAPLALPSYRGIAALVRLADTLVPPLDLTPAITRKTDPAAVYSSLKTYLEGHFVRQIWPLFPSAGAALALLGLRSVLVRGPAAWFTAGAGAILAGLGGMTVAARDGMGGHVLERMRGWLLPTVFLYFVVVAGAAAFLIVRRG